MRTQNLERDEIIGVIQLEMSYDMAEPHSIPEDSLCTSCTIKGKSFLCLVNKKAQYPAVQQCDEYQPKS